MRVESEGRAREGRGAISPFVVARAALIGPAAVVTLAAVLASIPPILHRVVAAAVQTSCNLCPPLADLVDENLYLDTLLGCDGLMVECGLEVLVESFPALLRRASSEGLGDAHPVQGALVADELHEVRILLLRPRSSPLSHCEEGVVGCK